MPWYRRAIGLWMSGRVSGGRHWYDWGMAEHKVVALERVEPEPSVPAGATIGWIVRVDEEGIWVDTEENAGGPLLSLCVAALSKADLEAAIADRRDAVLLFVVSTGQPVLLGLRQPRPSVDIELPTQGLDASIDGKRVQLEGRDEVVLRCGKASITMRRNGRIVIRGVQVESRATGRNRIKGGAVLIN